ncbi:histidine phosphatase family protein [Rhodoblastus sp.]|uniref:histidine phosphatase family protein n=1 Tax=Rhodoblastus sp. TaxID=1962975 RepID=UPI003F9CD0B9
MRGREPDHDQNFARPPRPCGGNLAGEVSRPARPTLTEKGRAQATALGKRIHDEWRPAAIYTGPLQRAVATGEAIARATGAPLRKLDCLHDIDYGDWQGRTHEEVEGATPALYATWFEAPQLMRFPGGDSLQDMFARGAEALRLVLERHPDETIVMVGHDSVNRAILLQVLELPISAYWRLMQDPCGLNLFDFACNHIRVVKINDTAHLSGFAG